VTTPSHAAIYHQALRPDFVGLIIYHIVGTRTASHDDSTTHESVDVTRSSCSVCRYSEGRGDSDGRRIVKEERCATRKELLAEMDCVRAKLGKTPFESMPSNYWRA
jgi:hypothetical protein